MGRIQCDTSLPVYSFRNDSKVVVAFGTADFNPIEMFGDDVIEIFNFDTQYQLCSKEYDTAPVVISDGGLEVGSPAGSLLICGPCAVESREQMDRVCQLIVNNGLKVLRAGCFKPRTSIYSFQGLGKKGIDILKEMRDKYSLLIATEVCEPSQIDEVLQVADIVQVGAKSMYDYELLRLCAQIDQPVILKRHYAARLEEFAQMADMLMSKGKQNIILCERGIRTFETATRFTLDLGAVVWIKNHLRLPVIVDPSHAFGMEYGVIPLAKAAMALGADGVMVEAHPEPERAMSDSKQQLTLEQMQRLINELKPIAKAVNKTLV